MTPTRTFLFSRKMKKKEYRKRIIEIEEERTSLLRQALFPFGTGNCSTLEEIVKQLEGMRNDLYKISDSIQDLNEK